MRNCPWSSVLNETTAPLALSAMNAVFASGLESGTPSLDGPPRTGLTVITPSSPVAGSVADIDTIAVITRRTKHVRSTAGRYRDAEKTEALKFNKTPRDAARLSKST